MILYRYLANLKYFLYTLGIPVVSLFVLRMQSTFSCRVCQLSWALASTVKSGGLDDDGIPGVQTELMSTLTRARSAPSNQI